MINRFKIYFHSWISTTTGPQWVWMVWEREERKERCIKILRK